MKNWTVFGAVALSACLAVSQAPAVTVFDNFGPGDTFNVGVGLTISDVGSSVGNYWAQACPFVPSASVTLDSVEIPIGIVSGTDSVVIQLHEDLGGNVGNLLEAFTTPTSGSFGSAYAPLVLTSIGHPVLTAGTSYWLAALPGGGDTWAAWNLSPVAGSVPIALSSDGGYTWGLTGPGTPGTFRVNGTPVPEPATLLLLGVAGLAVPVIRRRWR